MSSAGGRGGGGGLQPQGAALQTYNNELVQCLHELRQRRQEAAAALAEDERQRAEWEAERVKAERECARLDERVRQQKDKCQRYDQLLRDSEQAYLNILESSQVLLNVVKKDAKALEQPGSGAAGVPDQPTQQVTKKRDPRSNF